MDAAGREDLDTTPHLVHETLYFNLKCTGLYFVASATSAASVLYYAGVASAVLLFARQCCVSHLSQLWILPASTVAVHVP